MLKHRHLRDFLAIAQAHSLRRAAATLGLTQPAISRSLQELEKDLGVALFKRHARGVELTAAGEKFLYRAQGAMESIRRGYDDVRQVQGDMSGSVAVALSSASVLGLLPYAYPRFRRALPAVRLRIVEGQFSTIAAQLRDGRLDFYIGPPGNADGASYHMQHIMGNQRFVMARKDHPLQNARSLAELAAAQAEWLIVGLHEKVEREFEEVFSAHSLPSPAVRTLAESMLIVVTLLAATDALAIMPKVLALSPLFKDQLKAIPIREELAAPDLVQVWSARFPLTPAAEQFSLLLQRAAAQPYLGPGQSALSKLPIGNVAAQRK